MSSSGRSSPADRDGAPRLSAGVVVVREASAPPVVLLLRSYRYWDCPKGEVEASEHPFEAAVREVAEETGLTDLKFPWGRVSRDTPVYAGGKIARYFLATSAGTGVRLPINAALGRAEHHEYRWCTQAAAQQLVNARVGAILRWAFDIVRAGGPMRSEDASSVS
jgi:bis(5'-nucleosidyl)-tetraphosphatase